MRRKDQDRELLAQAIAQGIGYVGLTGVVVWLLLRLG
jgi:hypothetical protein